MIATIGEKVGSALKGVAVYAAFAVGERFMSKIKNKLDKKLEAAEAAIEKKRAEKEALKQEQERQENARKQAGLPLR